MSFCTFAATIDPFLGRLDPMSLSDQALMEMVHEKVSKDSIQHFHDDEGNWTDVCTWYCVECDADGHVISYHSNDKFQGTLSLVFLPQTIEAFVLIPDLGMLNLCGKLDTDTLPLLLCHIAIIATGFDGTVAMASFPEKLETISISMNLFGGSCDLTNLPKNLSALDVSENHFNGEISLGNLPPALKSLNLGYNEFQGSLTFDALPLTLEMLNISENKFCGEIDLLRLPKSVRRLIASDNCFLGVARIPADTHCAIILRYNSISGVVDAEGIDHPRKSQFLLV